MLWLRAFPCFFLSLILLPVFPAFGQVPWFRLEDGVTNPATTGYWTITSDSNPSMIGLGTGATLTGDGAFVNFTDNSTSDKIKVRRDSPPPLNGTGTTTCVIMRVNSGGSSGNYGFEHRESFGEIQVCWVKNAGNDDGIVRLANANIQLPVAKITDWHVYWFTHDPAGNTVRLWVDPDAADTSQATADLIGTGGTSTGSQITWGFESGGNLVNQDVDLAKWSLGVHAPAEDLPEIPTPTPTTTGNPTATPTPPPTNTPVYTPTPTFTPIPNRAVIVLTMVRQVGYYENGNSMTTPSGNRALYIHLSDVDGNRLDGANCQMRVNGGTVQALAVGTDSTFPDYYEFGFNDPGTVDRLEVRVSYGGVVSPYTPILYKDVPPYNDLYSWEMFFVYIPDMASRENTYIIRTQERGYDYSHVKLNTADGIVNDPPAYDYESDFRNTIQVGSAENTYSQTFVATGNRVVAAKAFVTTNFLDPGGALATAQYQATIHEGGPDGPQIGAASTPPKYFSFEYPKVTAFWPFDGPDSVPVVPGQTYALKVTKVPGGFTGEAFSLWTSQTDTYSGGELYRDGVPLAASQDMVGIVVMLNSFPKSGTPTPTPTLTPTITPTWTPWRPVTGVGENWKAY